MKPQERINNHFNKNKKAKKALYITVGIIFAFFLLVMVIAISANTGETATEEPTSEQASTEAEPAELAGRVRTIIDGMDDDLRASFASTSPEGFQGDITGVEPDTSSTVKVMVTTAFSDPTDSADGGKNIARKIFAYICQDIPELQSLYVENSAGLQSRTATSADVPGCRGR